VSPTVTFETALSVVFFDTLVAPMVLQFPVMLAVAASLALLPTALFSVTAVTRTFARFCIAARYPRHLCSRRITPAIKSTAQLNTAWPVAHRDSVRGP